MDNKRAQEILDSITMVNVNYRGIPVYIKDVNEHEATVFPLDEMDHEQIVDLHGLDEVNLINNND
ncbi:H-type small acid-soluble spore protein [Oceanobacillus bengalensis]|uniref:H-type small acid-soluble spore protein n=1 Tax=Oceanobacillus bengalensis TaxID=1435466 RepID=A0A494YSF2_9BACI|nr:H-type small acid-soluble spore protein [Oceanobacillus bengalensis]RKQ12871.1 H-type small acid-soluble spore protein [Oceanobacillus bengalensis]